MVSTIAYFLACQPDPISKEIVLFPLHYTITLFPLKSGLVNKLLILALFAI